MATSNRFSDRREARRRSWLRWLLLASLVLNVTLLSFITKVGIPWLEASGAPVRAVEDIRWVDLAPPQKPEQPLEPPRPPQDSQSRRIIENPRANDIEPSEASVVSERAASVEQETRGTWGVQPPGEEVVSTEPDKREGADNTDAEGEKQPARDGVNDARTLFPTGEQIARVLAEKRRKAAEQTGQSGQDLPLTVGESLEAIDPRVPQGQFTLLNAKSFRHAGFIRRVGQRVFDQMLGQLYSRGFAATLTPGAEGLAVVETIMNKKGEQISTRIYSVEGEPAFAEAGRVAMVRGAWDLNPPPGVEAEDGLIHWVLVGRIRFMGYDRYAQPQYQGGLSFGVL